MPIILLALAAGFIWAATRPARAGASPTPPTIASGRGSYGRGGVRVSYPHPHHAHHYHHGTQYIDLAPPPGMPSPMQVLGTYIAQGATPPQGLVVLAIAEAEAAGRVDLALAIRDQFLVTNAQQQQAIDVPAQPTPGQMQAMREQWEKGPQVPIATGVPGDDVAPGLSNEDMQAAYAAMGLHPALAPQLGPPEDPNAQPSPPGPDNIVVSGDVVALASRLAGTRQSHNPIPHVSKAAWCNFVSLVSRESPSFNTGRHIGRFRQRRERLIALGFDPMVVAASSEAQLDAFEAEMADAYQHVRTGDLIDYVGKIVQLGDGSTYRITLSGLLALIQAAGLRGACEWLDSPSDRDRFPHTTTTFTRANGVF